MTSASTSAGSTAPKFVQCDACRHHFTSMNALARHMEKTHTNNNVAISPPLRLAPLKPDGRQPCPYPHCSKAYKYTKALETHLISEHGESLELAAVRVAAMPIQTGMKRRRAPPGVLRAQKLFRTNDAPNSVPSPMYQSPIAPIGTPPLSSSATSDTESASLSDESLREATPPLDENEAAALLVDLSMFHQSEKRQRV